MANAPDDRRNILVEVVYALPERQVLKATHVPKGTTVAQAIAASGLHELFREADLNCSPLGVFGRLVRPDTILENGDRVEIYRPLIADPKTARRVRAQRRKR